MQARLGVQALGCPIAVLSRFTAILCSSDSLCGFERYPFLFAYTEGAVFEFDMMFRRWIREQRVSFCEWARATTYPGSLHKTLGISPNSPQTHAAIPGGLME